MLLKINITKVGNSLEEWWRVTGEVNPTDRRLWTYYHNSIEQLHKINIYGIMLIDPYDKNKKDISRYQIL